jgi:cytoskeleton protein RodZ
VALGNAGGVEVRRGAEALDLQPFRRANVARFAVSSDGSLQPSSD